MKDKNWRDRVTLKRSPANVFWHIYVDQKLAGETSWGIGDAMRIAKRAIKQIDKGIHIQ